MTKKQKNATSDVSYLLMNIHKQGATVRFHHAYTLAFAVCNRQKGVINSTVAVHQYTPFIPFVKQYGKFSH